KNRDDLARSYLYAAIIYVTIGDQFNNFPIGSDRRTAAPPLGRDKMDSVYRVAIANTTSGIAIAQATKNKSLELALTAMRARARQAKAVWTLLHPDCLRLSRSEEHTSELQSPDLVCRLLLEKKKKATNT